MPGLDRIYLGSWKTGRRPLVTAQIGDFWHPFQLEKGSFQKSPPLRDSGEFRGSRHSGELHRPVENKGEFDHFLTF